MNNVKWKITRFLAFFVTVTAAVNMVCMILQYFSLKRVYRIEKAYLENRVEEMQMKLDVDEALWKKYRKHEML
ncbi:hypothetical protein [Candidatus Merdisoma sp. JLR.KK006]|uniref:hypothetical protein n=1 Tax=Candidatus Merdisoma sp. JLR.KK006 TaxID=3112626 RepID=UPI002FEE73A4